MTTFSFHHVQLTIPPGGEDEARVFYGRVLGLEEVPRPISLGRRDGVWFRAGGFELHLGVDQEHRPAGRAHPGILVDDFGEIRRRLHQAGHATAIADEIPGYARFNTTDPFGNRLEFLARTG